MERVHPIFLNDGGQSAASIAKQLTAFCAKARTRLYIAIYKAVFSEAVGGAFVATLIRRANAGVDVRIAYDNTSATVRSALNDSDEDLDVSSTRYWLERHFRGTKVRLRPMSGACLMHDKYVVRDSRAVWTGSANFTDDSFAFQDNNVLVLDVAGIATLYEKDFEELWKQRGIARTGEGDGSVLLRSMRDRERHEARPTRIDVAFSPGDGAEIEAKIGELIESARRRVYIASMVISSSVILDALRLLLRRRPSVTVRGIVDHEQMSAVLAGWRRAGSDGCVLKWNAVRRRFVEKPLTGFRALDLTQRHDFMHNKLVVVDDTVMTGSFNFSHGATKNADNSVTLVDRDLANRYATYVRGVIGRYD